MPNSIPAQSTNSFWCIFYPFQILCNNSNNKHGPPVTIMFLNLAWEHKSLTSIVLCHLHVRLTLWVCACNSSHSLTHSLVFLLWKSECVTQCVSKRPATQQCQCERLCVCVCMWICRVHNDCINQSMYSNTYIHHCHWVLFCISGFFLVFHSFFRYGTFYSK